MTSRYVRRSERAERTRYVLRIDVPEGEPIIPAYVALLQREQSRAYGRPFRIINEAEVLLGPGASFDIASVRRRSDGVSVVRARLRPQLASCCEAAA